MIVISHHRSAALADRKRTDLEQRYPSAIIILLSRRNSKGNYSAHGKTFVWEVREKEEQREFVLHFDYGDEGGKDLIRWQVHVFGPDTATDAEVISAVRKANAGEGWPKGYKMRSIYWEKPNNAKRSGKQTDSLPAKLRRAGIAGGEAKVISRRDATKRRRRRNEK